MWFVGLGKTMRTRQGFVVAEMHFLTLWMNGVSHSLAGPKLNGTTRLTPLAVFMTHYRCLVLPDLFHRGDKKEEEEEEVWLC